ncbi:hypothetical protein [Runella sp.]
MKNSTVKRRRRYKSPSLKKYGSIATITREDTGALIDALGDAYNP